jgi:subtilisin family serine protease
MEGFVPDPPRLGASPSFAVEAPWFAPDLVGAAATAWAPCALDPQWPGLLCGLQASGKPQGDEAAPTSEAGFAGDPDPSLGWPFPTEMAEDALLAPLASGEVAHPHEDWWLQSSSAISSAPPDNGGNNFETARDIGGLIGSLAFSDWVGSSDRNDYYRFSVTEASAFSLSLTGLTANADVQLLNGSGSRLASSSNGGVASESISRALSVGTYVVRVYFRGASTGYALNLSATPTAPPPSPGSYSAVNGYGEASAERAIERLLNVTIPDVPNSFGAGLYGLDRLGAPEVWNYGYTGEGIVVAVADTGVDRNHLDLDSNIWMNLQEISGNGVDDDGNGYVDDVFGWNFFNNNNDTIDVQGHGTHVAGTIAAELNAFGVTGVAYGSKIMPVKVLSDSGSGSWTSVANGIRYAANNGADIINLSLGGGSGDLVLQSAIEYAWNRGVAVMMAAGNSGGSSPIFPAAYANRWGMAIGAVDASGSLAPFSNRAGTSVLDYVTAAGTLVYSTTPNNSYASYSGTSMATPHMAGAMALLMQANRDSGRNLSLAQLEQLFTASASNSASAISSNGGGASLPAGAAGASLAAELSADPVAIAPVPQAATADASSPHELMSSPLHEDSPPGRIADRQPTSPAAQSQAAPGPAVESAGGGKEPARAKGADSAPDWLAGRPTWFERSRKSGHGSLDLLTGVLRSV